MKKYILAFFLLVSTQAFAQIDGDYNFSFGVKAFSLAQMPKILQQSNPDEYVSMPFNGAILKFNDNQIAYRISGTYFYQKNKTFPNICDNCETATGSMSDYSIRLGFEKSFNYSVFQPYFGIDLGYRANNFNGIVKPQNTLSLNTPYDAITAKNSFVIAPIFGLKINVANQFSFYIEPGVDFLYSYERQETISSNLTNARTFNRFNKFEILLNAVSVGLQFHFVGNN